MKNIIALDIGGTSIKSGIVKSNGKFYKNSCKVIKIDSTKDKEYIINKFTSPIKKSINLLNKTNKDFEGIAISICHPFNFRKGISLIQNLDKYESIYGLNIKKIIQKKFSLSANKPVIFNHDAQCYGIGEVLFNDYKKYKKVIVLTIGTGIGSSFFNNQKIVLKGKGVPQFGWISGQKFKRGILNDYTSSVFMQKQYKKMSKETISIKPMAERAKNKDEIASKIFSKMGEVLGSYLKKNFINDFNAECIIFGGQISLSSDLFINRIKYHLKNCKNLKKITRAKNIKFAGLKGAAHLLINNYE